MLKQMSRFLKYFSWKRTLNGKKYVEDMVDALRQVFAISTAVAKMKKN